MFLEFLQVENSTDLNLFPIILEPKYADHIILLLGMKHVNTIESVLGDHPICTAKVVTQDRCMATAGYGYI